MRILIKIHKKQKPQTQGAKNTEAKDKVYQNVAQKG